METSGSGAAVGGITHGIRAEINGRDFFTGDIKIPPKPIKILPSGIKNINPKVEFDNSIINKKASLFKPKLVNQLKINSTGEGLNIDDTVSYLNENANYKPIGRCAKFIRKALEKGGMKTVALDAARLSN